MKLTTRLFYHIPLYIRLLPSCTLPVGTLTRSVYPDDVISYVPPPSELCPFGKPEAGVCLMLIACFVVISRTIGGG